MQEDEKAPSELISTHFFGLGKNLIRIANYNYVHKERKFFFTKIGFNLQPDISIAAFGGFVQKVFETMSKKSEKLKALLLHQLLKLI